MLRQPDGLDCETGPEGFADTDKQRHPTNFAVRIARQRHDANPGCAVRQRRQRFGRAWRTPDVCKHHRAAPQHGDRASALPATRVCIERNPQRGGCRRYRTCKLLIAVDQSRGHRVGRGVVGDAVEPTRQSGRRACVGASKQDVDRNRAGFGVGYGIDQLRHSLTRPRPVAERGNRALVDVDDNDAGSVCRRTGKAVAQLQVAVQYRHRIRVRGECSTNPPARPTGPPQDQEGEYAAEHPGTIATDQL